MERAVGKEVRLNFGLVNVVHIFLSLPTRDGS